MDRLVALLNELRGPPVAHISCSALGVTQPKSTSWLSLEDAPILALVSSHQPSAEGMGAKVSQGIRRWAHSAEITLWASWHDEELLPSKLGSHLRQSYCCLLWINNLNYRGAVGQNFPSLTALWPFNLLSSFTTSEPKEISRQEEISCLPVSFSFWEAEYRAASRAGRGITPARRAPLQCFLPFSSVKGKMAMSGDLHWSSLACEKLELITPWRSGSHLWWFGEGQRGSYGGSCLPDMLACPKHRGRGDPSEVMDLDFYNVSLTGSFLNVNGSSFQSGETTSGDRAVWCTMVLNDLDEQEEIQFAEQNKIVWNKGSRSRQEWVVEGSPDTEHLVS